MLDATKHLRRRLAGKLRPDETLLAAVSVHREGTTAAALDGISAAIAADQTTSVSFRETSAPDRRGGPQIDTGPYLYLALTSRRVLVVRRSALGLARDVVFEAPIGEVDALGLRPRSSAVELRLSGDRVLELETPKAPRFLPEVYRRLPDLLAEAKAGLG